MGGGVINDCHRDWQLMWRTMFSESLLSFWTFQLRLKWMSLIKLLFGLSDVTGSIFLCPPFVFADTWLTASFLLSSTSSFLLSTLPPCPEGVNCRVGRVLVRAPGWQGPPTLSFTQDSLIRGSVRACLSRQLMDNQAALSCIRASADAVVNCLWWR